MGGDFKKWAKPSIHKDLLMGTPGKDAEFISPELENLNASAAAQSAQIRNRQITTVGDQLGNVSQQWDALQKMGTPEQQANAEIERSRRAMALGYQNQQNNINQQVARRGLGNSASGLFASLNNQRQQQNQLADLESSRFGLQRSIFGQNLNMQNALIGQQGFLSNQIQMPGTQYMNAAQPGTKGVIGAIGGIFGGMFGGPAGAAGGQAAGDAIGENSTASQKQIGFGSSSGAAPQNASSYAQQPWMAPQYNPRY